MDFTNLERIEVNGLGSNDVIDAGGVGQSIELARMAATGRRSDPWRRRPTTSFRWRRPRPGLWRRCQRRGVGWRGRDRLGGTEGDDLLASVGGIDRFQLGDGNVIGDWERVDFLALNEVQLTDGTAVTTSTRSTPTSMAC